MPHSKEILEHLKNNPNIKFFSTWQVLEEKIKAHLITKDDHWKKIIEEDEKHGYFNGQIGFILEFAGIVEYYNANKNCDWSAQENSVYFEKYLSYAEKADRVFEDSYENRINNKDYVFERAVLTKGDYLTNASQYRKNILSTNLVKNNIKRDHSWKRLLRIIATQKDTKKWEDRRLLVKEVFDDSRFNKDDLIISLESICEEKTYTWRDYFIDCPDLIKYCKQGFIRFEDEKNILLYGQSQSNHMHSEMYSYYLWKKVVEPQKNKFAPFKNVYYKEVKSIDDKACIVLNGFCHNRINYEIYIYYSNKDTYQKPYKIAYKKSKGDNLPEKYGDDIKHILEGCRFNWFDEYTSFLFTCDDINKVEETLMELVAKLENDL